MGLGKKAVVMRNGLALETDGHCHAVIYDAASGTGKTTFDDGHLHAMNDYELRKHDLDLHEHIVKFASTLTRDEAFQVAALVTLDQEDKGERTKEQKIESCVLQLKKEGAGASKAYAICTAAQNKKNKKDATDQGPGVCSKCDYRGKMPKNRECPKCGAPMKMMNE